MSAPSNDSTRAGNRSWAYPRIYSDYWDFINDDPDRQGSKQVHYGMCWFTDAKHPRTARLRVSWIEETGELYAVPPLRYTGGPLAALTIVHGRSNIRALMSGWYEGMRREGIYWLITRFGLWDMAWGSTLRKWEA